MCPIFVLQSCGILVLYNEIIRYGRRLKVYGNGPIKSIFDFTSTQLNKIQKLVFKYTSATSHFKTLCQKLSLWIFITQFPFWSNDKRNFFFVSLCPIIIKSNRQYFPLNIFHASALLINIQTIKSTSANFRSTSTTSMPYVLLVYACMHMICWARYTVWAHIHIYNLDRIKLIF